MENNNELWITLKEKGNTLFKESKYKEAITYYERALKINSSIDILYSNIGTCQKCLKLYKEAINSYKKALELNPNNTKNLNRLASIYIIIGNISEAKNIQEKILNLEPNNPAYIEQMNNIDNIIKSEAKMIEEEIVFNNYKKAEDICKKILEKVPHFINYKIYYIKILFYNNKISEIIEFIDKEENAVDKIKEEEFYYLQNISREISENKTMENLIQKKMRILIDYLNEIFNKNKNKESIEIYNKIIELEPQNKIINSLSLINRALCYKHLNKITVAFGDLNQSIKINQINYEAFYQRSKIFYEYKMFEEARTDLEIAKKFKNNLSTSFNDIELQLRNESNNNIYNNNYYKILGVNYDASKDEIKKAYKKLLIKYNPSKYYENEEEKNMADNIFMEINNAYEVLIDEEKRKVYNYEYNQDNLCSKNNIDNYENNYIRKLLIINKAIINDEPYKDDEIIIKYKVDFDNSNCFIDNQDNCMWIHKKNVKRGIKLFGKKFIENNKDNCFFILNNFKYELDSIINEENLDIKSENGEFEIKLIGFNNIYDMSYMFENCITLKSLNDFSKLNVSKIENMSYMFYGCSSLELLPDISKWNTQNVKDMSYMFYGCSSLELLPDISKWDTQNVKNMSYMFCNCSSLIALPDISKWNTKNLVYICSMFKKCRCLSVIPNISKWDTTNVTNISDIFNGCESLCFLPKASKFINKKVFFKSINKGCYSLIYYPRITYYNENLLYHYSYIANEDFKDSDCISAINYN